MPESPQATAKAQAPWLLLCFDSNYRLELRRDTVGALLVASTGKATDPLPSEAHFLTQTTLGSAPLEIYCRVGREPGEVGAVISLEALNEAVEAGREVLSEALAVSLESLHGVLFRLPYLDLGTNDYIYRFRTAKERNRKIYIDTRSNALYQSRLCAAIKAVRRTKEKTSGAPALLDFGSVRYVIPSHFGFCLGVQNAIERAYEAVAAYPDTRVFMLSELIHNPFVNKDLLARGLRYLQTDKGLPLNAEGKPANGPHDPAALWNQLKSEDTVIIPAFGATNEDKTRLISKGLAIREYDATCMLVEKVWKSARRYAAEGYTVVIHGKSEHEETKATFSNSSAQGPSLIVRNLEHARLLGEVILAKGPEKTRRFEQEFAGLYSEDFDPNQDLEKIAVVNQTTLLRNETLAIIEYLKGIMAEKYGAPAVEKHIWSQGKGDTLCYATQVNQDALQKALEHPIDAALVIGGKNSSNTYQLYRVCKDAIGERAHYIQSEDNLISSKLVRHHIFHAGPAVADSTNAVERAFLSLPKQGDLPLHLLLTGGASCPDGIIQQVISRINSFFPPESLRSMEAVLAEIEGED
ncbi:MAG: 4-hydroxy-3-methylbut-2-enyl diphosphate reductase [Verrucomicrobia bacterium]|nr:4-hydroxy-3-methylbut-2-enyl diphosphate reductase [Verrucomicrobiota bacterium]